MGAKRSSPGPWRTGRWRTGRKVGRTIYDANDRLIGVMDTPELARKAAAAPEMYELLRSMVSHRGAALAEYPEIIPLLASIDGGVPDGR